MVFSACALRYRKFSKLVSSACALRYSNASWYPQPVLQQGGILSLCSMVTGTGVQQGGILSLLYDYRNGSSAGWYPQPALQQPPDGRPDGGADGDGAVVPAYLHPHADR